MNKFSGINTKKRLCVIAISSIFFSTNAVNAYAAGVAGNLTLSEAVTTAIKNAPSMIMAAIQVDLAKADEKEAGDPFDPTVKASFAIDRVRGYSYPTELQQFASQVGAASVSMGNYNTNVLGLSPTLAPAIPPPSLSTFMTDHQDNTEFKSSISKLFRTGIYTDLSLIMQSSDSDKLRADFAQIPGVLSNGIPPFMAAPKPGAQLGDYSPVHPSLIQLTVNFPLLKFSGENNIATANERMKRLQREAAEMNLKHGISGIIQNVVNSYWDFKGALTKLQFTRESEAQVSRWYGKLEQSVAAKKRDKAAPSTSTAEIAHLQGFATQLRGDVSKAEEAVNLSRNKLAQAIGISSEDARKIVQAQDDFPLDWSSVLASFDDNVARKRWNALAEQNRFDLKAASLQLDAAKAIHLGSQNDELPKLDLAVILKRAGLSMGGSNVPNFDSLRSGGSALGYTVQLGFEMKLDNDKAKAQVTRTRYLTMQKDVEYKNAKRSIGLAVDTAISSVRNSLVGLAAAKKQTEQYVTALDSLVKNDVVASGKVFDLVIIEQARLKAYNDNVTAIQNVANAVTAANFQTGKLIKQVDNYQQVAINDLTKLP